LKLTLQANRLLDTARDSGADEDYDKATLNATQRPGSVPLAGRVAAGVGIEAIENCQMLSLDSMFGASDDVFALEIDGESMIDDGISDGDYVVCKKARTAENGQLVVAILEDNSATVKRFYDEGDVVRLQPANPDFEPIYSDNCRIDAVVLGLLRRL
jgi:repressor LexA